MLFRSERVAADQTPATPIAGAMALADLLANFLDGDERGWAAEFDFLRREHAEHIEQLATSIREDGITTPILLGNDGRVWDGHHRLCVADALGLVRVPVIQTPATDSEREKVFPDDYGWADLMTLIDHHWPTDVFPVAPDSADRDTGPRLLSLVRRLAEQAATIERVRAVHVEDLFRGHLSNGCKTCSGGEWPCETATALGSQRTEGQG